MTTLPPVTYSVIVPSSTGAEVSHVNVTHSPGSASVKSVRTVAAGRRFISPEVKGLLAFDPPAPTLSPRQQEVLASLVKGFNNTEIAAQLGISKTVAKEHVETLLVKLDAANRTEAVAIALRKNLVKT